MIIISRNQETFEMVTNESKNVVYCDEREIFSLL